MSRYIYRERPSVEDLRLERPKWVLDPDSTTKLVLDNIVLACIATITILTPLEIAFDMHFWGGFEILFNVVFVMDIVVSFNCAYHAHGQIIYDRKRIAIRYLKTWFIVDVLSTFPWHFFLEEMAFESNEYNLIKHVKVSKLSRSVRAVRAVRLVRLMRMAKFNPARSLKNRPCVVLLKQFSMLAVLCHIVGCLWFTIGIVEYPDSWLRKHDGLTMRVAQLLNSSANFTGVHHDFNVWPCYITSAYWAFTTLSTVGFGDIVGTTPSEYIFTMVVMGAGVMWTGITVASITQSISNKRMIERKLKVQRAHATFLLRSVRLNQFLYSRIYDHYWYKPVQLHDNFLLTLPSSLNSKLTLILRRGLVPNHSVLSTFQDLQTSIAFEMYSPGCLLCVENTSVQKIYFILKGTVRATHAGVFFAEFNSNMSYGIAEHHHKSFYMLTLHVQTYTIVASIPCCMLKTIDPAQVKISENQLQGLACFSEKV